jgi:hypothetical protein
VTTNGELGRIWEEIFIAYFGYSSSICLKVLREIIKNFSKDRQTLLEIQSEYLPKSGVLPLG